jgi:tripartite-type tricarboxylate transporter receptor subunit TctC
MLRSFSRRATVLAFAALAVAGAQAQGFPSKPVTLIAPFSPGGSADGIARIIGRELSVVLGQPVIVDNKPGAGGALGLIAVAKAPADGYTIGMGATGAIAINPHLPDAPPLEPEKDLAPIAKLADIPLVLVAGAKAGIGSLKAFLDKARATSGGLPFGTPGQYTAQHLSGELLASMTKVPLSAVPYRGSAPAVTGLLGGTIPAAVVDLTAAYPHVKAGTLVALGVTSANRSRIAPEIPTIAEQGVSGYAAPAWMGLFAPAKTPTAVIRRLSEALKIIMAKPEVQAQITALSAEPSYLDGKGFGQFIAGESGKWAAVVAKVPASQK